MCSRGRIAAAASEKEKNIKPAVRIEYFDKTYISYTEKSLDI